MSIEHVKCLIIGSGPAGYTAAIYAARANMKPVLYQGQQPGGQLTTTNEVENFPGYVDGVTGPEMMVQLMKQAQRFDTDVRDGWITKVDFSGPVHKAWINGETEIHADTVIISTGVGAGDSACEEAHYLSKLCTKVTMLVRRDEFRASKIMADRVKNTENIEILFNTETVEVLGDDVGVSGARVKSNVTGKEHDIPATGFFVAIGHKPNTDIFKDYLTLDETGYVVNTPGSSKTNVDGVFVSGDAADHVYRQAITAAGTGCMAALDAERYLAAKEGAEAAGLSNNYTD